MPSRRPETRPRQKPDRIETELKLGLPGVEAWQRIREQQGRGPVLDQSNHFFDAPDGRMARARVAVRLRSERSDASPARYVLAVKGVDTRAEDAETGESAEKTADPFLTRRAEFEATLSETAFETHLVQGIRLEPFIAAWRREEGPGRWGTFLDELEARTADTILTRRFGFQNHRETLPLVLRDSAGPIELALELDRSRFPSGRVDYEIEVERSSEQDGAMARTRRALVGWLETEIGVTPFAVESKLARLERDVADVASPRSDT